jgi:hypothetical protein
MHIVGKLQQAQVMLRQQGKPLRRNFSEAQLRAYFTRNDTWKVKMLFLMLAAGVCCFVVGHFRFPGDADYPTAGAIFLLLAFCFWLLIEYGIKVPTDAEYDAWVDHKAWEAFGRAWRKVDEEGLTEPNAGQFREQVLFIHGFALAGTKQAKKYRAQDLLAKTGKDGGKRYSINVYTFFVPMEHQLAVFAFDINAVNHRDHRSFIQQYFFADVVGITTEDELDMISRKGVEHTYRTESFSLRICDGNRISATIRSIPVDPVPGLETYKLPDSDVDRTISRIRLLLRAKKQGPSAA